MGERADASLFRSLRRTIDNFARETQSPGCPRKLVGPARLFSAESMLNDLNLIGEGLRSVQSERVFLWSDRLPMLLLSSVEFRASVGLIRVIAQAIA